MAKQTDTDFYLKFKVGWGILIRIVVGCFIIVNLDRLIVVATWDEILIEAF